MRKRKKPTTSRSVCQYMKKFKYVTKRTGLGSKTLAENRWGILKLRIASILLFMLEINTFRRKPSHVYMKSEPRIKRSVMLIDVLYF